MRFFSLWFLSIWLELQRPTSIWLEGNQGKRFYIRLSPCFPSLWKIRLISEITTAYASVFAGTFAENCTFICITNILVKLHWSNMARCCSWSPDVPVWNPTIIQRGFSGEELTDSLHVTCLIWGTGIESHWINRYATERVAFDSFVFYNWRCFLQALEVHDACTTTILLK